MVTKPKSFLSYEDSDKPPAYHAEVTFESMDSIVADGIVVTGHFRDAKELGDYIVASTIHLMGEIEKEQSDTDKEQRRNGGS